MITTHSHLDAVRKCWLKISDLRAGTLGTTVSGRGLDLPELVAVARYQVLPQLTTDPVIRRTIDESVAFVVASSEGAGASIYGVTTGVGSSGELLSRQCPACRLSTTINHFYLFSVTRTSDRNQLQIVLLKQLCSGVLPLWKQSTSHDPTFRDDSLILPESWVKGAIFLRLNSLMQGLSGCRWLLIEHLHQLLIQNIIPCAPLRQSISASGDLAPLGYIAASLTDTIPVQVWSGTGSERKRVSAVEARRAHGIPAITFGPKEALSIVNGTGPSCAVAALALHDANILALASQALTALAIEALTGTPETYEAFIHEVARPHPGQVEVARIGRVLLAGSQLAQWHDETNPEHILRQDRYGLRTAPQWIGPQIEELMHAWSTIELEMNSTTDNPIIDLDGKRSLHGGNFQGTSVALVMEKIRIGLQHFGRLAYAQFVELGSPSLSRGLPPDLAGWEPSLDFGTKGMDVATASYVSELSYVSNTVTNHVQSAETHNESVNSLALISARYTFTAIQLLQMIFANHLYALCQAIDLRAINAQFFAHLHTHITSSLEDFIRPPLPSDALQRLAHHLFGRARVEYARTGHMDSAMRFGEVLRPLVADVLVFLENYGASTSVSIATDASTTHIFPAAAWRTNLASTLTTTFQRTRLAYFQSPPGSAAPLLGNTVSLYRFVRETLGVPMHTGLAEYDVEGLDEHVSRIYGAFESGEIAGAMLACMEG